MKRPYFTKYIKTVTAVTVFTLFSACILMRSEVSGGTKDDIQVSNEVGDEEAFSAEELRKYLEEHVKNNDQKDKEPKNWKDYNGQKDNEDEAGDSDADEAKDGATESDDNGLYVPKESEKWMLILVNKQHPIPSDYDPVLVDINGSARIRKEIAKPLADMFEAAAHNGVKLTVCSAYRSHEHQQELFDRKIRNYTRSGMSYLDAFRIGSYSVIIPGTSEHELGMALDIVTPGYVNLNEGFAETEAGIWLRDNAYKYGFILRYPKGKEYITGITFEPWHYRYVGKGAAGSIYKSGLTLEEYVEEIGLY